MLWLSLVFPEVFSVTMKINTELFLKNSCILRIGWWIPGKPDTPDLSSPSPGVDCTGRHCLGETVGVWVINTYFLSLESWVCKEMRARKDAYKEEGMTLINVYWPESML